MKNILQNLITKALKGAFMIVALLFIAPNIQAQCDTKITDLDGNGKDYICAESTVDYEAVRSIAAVGSTISWDLSDGGTITTTTDNDTTATVTIQWDSIPDSGPYYLTMTEDDVVNACSNTDVLEIYMEKSSINMTCNNLVLISLDNNCVDTITPDEITEAQLYPDENYEVTLFNKDITPRAEPIATMQDLGDTLMVMVRHTCSGIACMGNVAFQDKLATMLSCRQDTIRLNCSESPEPENVNVGFPLVPGSHTIKVDENKYNATIPGDCGGEFTLVYSDEVTDYPCGSHYQYIIKRTWAAIDKSGNSWVCDEIIVSTWADFAAVCAPPHFDGLNGHQFFQCNDSHPHPPANPPSIYWPYKDSIPGPDITGYPSNAECESIQFLYEDLEIPGCGYTRKILRTWIILDWCTGKSKSCEQILAFVDDTPPIFHLPPDTLEFNANLEDCFGSAYPLPDPIIDYECSGTTYEVIGYNFRGDGNCDAESSRKDDVFFKNGKFGISNLPVDSVVCVSYKVTDECGLFSYGNMRVVIRDRNKPTAACETHTVVTLGVGSKLYATSLDDDSWDNCGIVKYEIKRTTNKCNHSSDLHFGEYVSLCCNDVNQDVMVILRVTDNSGNFNECMGWVRVDDVERPVLTYCPPSFSIDCGDNYSGLFTGGRPTATDNCGLVPITKRDIPHLNDCGLGYITRIWTIKDKSGLTTASNCTQTITVNPPDALTLNDFYLPNDITLNGCWPGVDIDESVTGIPVAKPSVSECTDLGIAHSDRVELNPINNDDACVIIHRTFTIGDWCRPNMDFITYTQEIYINDGGAPVFTDCGSETVVSGAACTADVTVTAVATDDCTSQANLRYSFEVDKGNDGTIDITGVGNEVNATFERGNNKIIFTALDACGNESTCTKYVRVVDSKPPTPLCLQKITTSLGDDGTVTLNARIFDHGSTDNCTPSNLGVCGCLTELRFSFTTNVADSLITYNCDSLDNGIGKKFELSVYVFDLDNNKDNCNVILNVLDSKDVCTDSPDPNILVQGFVFDENQNGMPGFKIKGKTLNQVEKDIAETNTNGKYELHNLGAYEKYEIVPEKNDDPLDGLTTLDLVLMQKHILDIEAFDSPYKYIAADANNSGSITASDILLLRKLILGLTDELPSKKSWKFLQAYSEFDNPNNPWYFDNKYVTEELYLGIDSLDFIAVKIGDVNHSANAYQVTSGLAERSVETEYFTTKNTIFNTQEKIPVDIRLEKNQAIAGFQFTLEFDADVLKFVNIENNALNLSASNINTTKIDKGIITFSWNKGNGITLQDNEKLFRLNFKSIGSGILNDAISISSKMTKAEIYNKDLDISELELRFTGDEFDDISFYQNRPNPFSNQTEILFNLPEDTFVSFKIYDSTGKIISSTHRHYSKGQNSISVSGSDLNKSGIYFYEFTTNKSSVTKRMIYIK